MAPSEHGLERGLAANAVNADALKLFNDSVAHEVHHNSTDRPFRLLVRNASETVRSIVHDVVGATLSPNHLVSEDEEGQTTTPEYPEHGGGDHQESLHVKHRHPDDGKLLHSDTIILVSSLAVMILLGLVMFYVISCMTDFRNRRIVYEKSRKMRDDKQPLDASRPDESNSGHSDSTARN